MKSKAPYHHGDLKQTLIQAALGIIEEEGASALSLRAVARQAGVSHAAPYAHFEDKEALVAALKDAGFRELLDRLTATLAATGPDPLTRLRALGRTYLDFAFGQPAQYEVMMRRPLAKLVPGFHYVETGRAIFALLATEISRVQLPGKAAKSHQPALVAMCSWSMLHGLCALWLDGPMEMIAPEGTQLQELAEQFLEYLVDQLGRG